MREMIIMTVFGIIFTVLIGVCIWLTKGFMNLAVWDGSESDPHNVLTTTISIVLHGVAGVIGLFAFEMHALYFFVGALMFLPIVSFLVISLFFMSILKEEIGDWVRYRLNA